MPKIKPDDIAPTPEEDAAIRAAIAEDLDTFELDARCVPRSQTAQRSSQLYEQWYGNPADQESPLSENGTPRSDA